MEVEDVDLVQRDQVDVPEHVIDAEEVTGDIEHRPAVLEARPVVDLGSGDRPRAGAHGPSLGGDREHLAQRRQRSVQADRRCRGDAHSGGVGAQRVALGARSIGWRDGDDDVAAAAP